jgi:DNA-binding CsgD family transcriptional regulator
MAVQPYKYSIFFDFIESYLHSGFHNINADDAIMQRLEMLLQENQQFLTVVDMGQIKYLFTSIGSKDIIGIMPDKLNPSHYVNIVHPDDYEKLGIVRSQAVKLGNEIYFGKMGSALLSYTVRLLNTKGNYSFFIFQDYFFNTKIPHQTAILLQLVTNIDCFTLKPNCFHYYSGNNVSLFKFPNEKLLKIGTIFSRREMEVIRLIEAGLSSEQIAQKLFRSVHTIETHRQNILLKAEKSNTTEVILDLKNNGLL